MKKIDLHIHTVKSLSDSDFEFDIKVLEHYVEESQLDVIAITNHNLFDSENYQEIVDALDIMVYPGIEVDIEGCHILVIAPRNFTDFFKDECNALSKEISTPEDSITFEKFELFFPNYCDYLVIPHYENKKPAISNSLLLKFGESIKTGEVSNPKRFNKCKKNEKSLVPAIFSDLRVKKDLKVFPNTGTFIDIDGINFSNIKLALSSKDRVYIDELKLEDEFVIHGNVNASTGLNLVVGRRSSGKTHLLDSVCKSFPNSNIKYIPQFSIVHKAEEKLFAKTLNEENSITTQNYLNELGNLIAKYKNIDMLEKKQELFDYVTTLKKFAEEKDLEDIFSSTTLFNEDPFKDLELNSVSSLINSITNIIDNTDYKELIERYVDKENLIELLRTLLIDSKLQRISIRSKLIANEIVRGIKTKLDLGSSRTQKSESSFNDIAKNILRVQYFDSILSKILEEEDITTLELNPGRFTRKVRKRRYASTNELITYNSIGKVTLKSPFDDYYVQNRFFDYLIALKNVSEDLIKPQHFVCLEYSLRNNRGSEVSGGERAEYLLSNEIKQASKYDFLLIDEPEASFDNIFLNESIKKMIRDISLNTTTFVTTHNSSLGAELIPKKILYTEFQNGEYTVYSGKFGAENLVNKYSSVIPCSQVVYDTLESGKDKYEKRREIYESIEN